MKPNALIIACDCARKSKLPVFFEDRFFDRSVESGIVMVFFKNTEEGMFPKAQNLELYCEFNQYNKKRNK